MHKQAVLHQFVSLFAMFLETYVVYVLVVGLN